jgi:hypothetical protein
MCFKSALNVNNTFVTVMGLYNFLAVEFKQLRYYRPIIFAILLFGPSEGAYAVVWLFAGRD